MMKKVLFGFVLTLSVITTQAQNWRYNADSLIVNSVFADVIGHGDIYTFPELLTSNDTIFSIEGDTILVPYTSCYGYFIDLLPYANWAHPCKYCFINESNSYYMVSLTMPPIRGDLLELSLCPRPNPNPIHVTTDTTYVRNCKPSDTNHNWAVIICGDCTEQRFWFDLSSVYSVLTNVYGYQEGGSWGDYSDRRIIAMAPDVIKNCYQDDLYSSDLNGNADPDGDRTGDFFNWSNGEYTHFSKENIRNIFRCFAGDEQCPQEYNTMEYLRELTEEDRLFIYITGHGSCDGRGSYFSVTDPWNNTQKIHDDEFADWLHGIKCSQISLVMQNCFSGGFIEKFMEDISTPDCMCKNRVGQSAASANSVSRAEIYGVYIESSKSDNSVLLANEFTYYWAAAALGYYPYYKTKDHDGNLVVDKGPWNPNDRIVGGNSMNWHDYFDDYELTQSHSQYDVDSDTDSDGVLSINELFEFANNLDTWSRQGYYYPDHNDTLGQQFDPEYTAEYPLQDYESTFTKEAATIVGYEGQIDGCTNSGTAEQPYRLCGDIWVSPGSTLTMTDDVQSPENVGINIKPSGKLLIEGATFTNYPEQGAPMWKGIQVWGKTDKHQIIEDGQYWQGILELKAATIQNAITGIDVWNPETDNSTGGVVWAKDAHFKNNSISVFFHPYENQFEHPNSPGTVVTKDNASYFKNCMFIVDSNILGSELFSTHVKLFGVRGIRFNGCDFQYDGDLFLEPCKTGIYAFDAGFKLDVACTPDNYGNPCTMIDKSSFEGFGKAVVSVNDGAVGIRPILIKNTIFSNNRFGIHTCHSGFATILNSTFYIGNDTSQCSMGIYVEHTPCFTIEQDTFDVFFRPSYEMYGVVVKDSRSQNLIYKNVFKNLYCANLSIGRNNTWILPRSIADAKADIIGLEYRCNENMNNLCDFFVQGGSNYHKLGIQNNQGAVEVPANNTFSRYSQYHFVNGGNYGINYYCNPELANGIPSSTYAVTMVETTDTVGCPSHYDIGGVSYNDTLIPVLNEVQRLQREEDYYRAYMAYSTLRALYRGMVDGGDTENEIEDIEIATPSDMWTLRTQLLGHSPYLSDEVLISMLNRDDVFPQSVLFEILASNPDELKSDTLINYLTSMNNPFPDYMIGLLRQIADGVTPRTAIESQLARYSQEYRQAAGDIVRSILCDTVIDKASLVEWLGCMEDMEMDREIVSLYVEEGDFSNAIALASMFPELYGLTGNSLVEHNDYMTLLNLYQSLNTQERTILQLDSTERVTIEHIAYYGVGVSQAMAKSIMMGVFGYNYEECPSDLHLEIPIRGFDDNVYSFSSEETIKAIGFSVSVSPNPAKTWIVVDYSLPVGVTQAKMSIVNSLGVTVSTYDLYNDAVQKVLDLREMTPGFYTYSVQYGKFIQTGKLVVVK